MLKKNIILIISIIIFTFFKPECIYLTSWDIKQLNCRNDSVVLVTSSASLSTHFHSTSNEPPKNWSIVDLKILQLLYLIMYFSKHWTNTFML